MTRSSPSKPHHPAYLFFTGLCMGAADVIPGVSGGTMAFVLGVYPELLEAIKAFDFRLASQILRRQWREAAGGVPFAFLIPLGLGIVTAILSLAELLTYLLDAEPLLLFSFFFGLILASIITLALRHSWNGLAVLGAIVGAGTAYWLVGLVPAEGNHSPLMLFLSGSIAICAMILPGISGAFILLILGQYAYCVGSISELLSSFKQADVSRAFAIVAGTILPFGLGAALGLSAFARVLSWLLRHHQQLTVGTLIGFMTGSLRRIWPYKEALRFGTDHHGDPILLEWRNRLPNMELDPVIWSVFWAVFAFILIHVLDHVYDRRNPLILWMQGKRAVTPSDLPHHK